MTVLSGECLCGEVKYELSGEVKHFLHCHCRRCRKASGAGHASLIIVESGSLQWITGEGLLGHYKVPEAERFSTCFCKHCGSPLPRFSPETGRAVIPAGSLENTLDIQPEGRIFWDSRANWSCSDDLPVYAQYPES